jgi:hypothetical protein
MGPHDYKRNIKASQRFEYGTYQFLDHFFGRERMFKLFGKRRRKFYKNLYETLKQSGEGRMVPIERRKNLSLEEFKKNYVKKGMPVIMEGAAKEWNSTKTWSLDYFKEQYGGDEIVLVQLQKPGYPYETITLGEVIDDIKKGGSKYYRFYPLLEHHPERVKDFDYNWLLKLKNKLTWFDAFQAFIGPKNGATGLHVEGTCNVFIQFNGKKHWKLYPPYYMMVIDPNPVKNVYRHAPMRSDKGLPFDPFNPDYKRPFELLKYIDHFDGVLEPGDLLWLPPYYWHCVQNPTDSIGVSFRWLAPLYGFTVAPLYMFLDFCATNPPVWKGAKIIKKDANLVYLAETGQLDDYLKKKAEREAEKKSKVQNKA